MIEQNQAPEQEAIELPVLTVAEAMERLTHSVVVMHRVAHSFELARQAAEFANQELMTSRELLDRAILNEAAAKQVQP